MENRKKILIYNGQLFMGGIERVLISYLQELSKEKDLEITLLIKENDPEKNVFLQDVPKNIEVIFIKSEDEIKRREEISKKKSNIFYRAYYQIFLEMQRIKMKNWLKKYFKENRFHSVIDFDMSLGKYIEVTEDKKIGWSHYSLAAKTGKKRERFRKRLGKYDKIVLICDEMQQEFNEIYPELKDRGVRIYNPMRLEEIVEKSLDIDGLSSEERELLKDEYIVGVSRLVKGKGREDLIEIFGQLKNRGRKEKLYILGDGPELENLKKQAKELKIENEVLFLGQKKNPYVWMKNAKLFVHPSYGEGLPTVLIESMACGTPVAAYDCPTGPKEILGDGKYGILIKTGDKENLQERVYEYLEREEELRGSYREKFHEIIDEFSGKNVVKKLKEIL